MQKIRKVAVIIIMFFMFLNSLFFIGIGVYKSIYAYVLIVEGRLEERPGVFIGEALDSFLISLFFIIFSMGVSKLFLPDSTLLKGVDLPWLKIEHFSELKLIIWEMLLTTLFVYFFTIILLNGENMEWTMLVIPGSILLLSVAYKLLKKGH
ncbi:MAG TPA: YqhA family protein [Agriterribacter sp.]|nr:YqhA family protein [Agriterribacter sp.]